jgi:hypothetical protein
MSRYTASRDETCSPHSFLTLFNGNEEYLVVQSGLKSFLLRAISLIEEKVRGGDGNRTRIQRWRARGRRRLRTTKNDHRCVFIVIYRYQGFPNLFYEDHGLWTAEGSGDCSQTQRQEPKSLSGIPERERPGLAPPSRKGQRVDTGACNINQSCRSVLWIAKSYRYSQSNSGSRRPRWREYS